MRYRALLPLFALVWIAATCCVPCQQPLAPPKKPSPVGGAVARPTPPPAQALSVEDRERLFVVSPTTVERIDEREPLTLTDIIVMSQLGISTNVIISQIDRTESRFNLSQEDVGNLSEAGVNQEVIDYIIQS